MNRYYVQQEKKATSRRYYGSESDAICMVKWLAQEYGGTWRAYKSEDDSWFAEAYRVIPTHPERDVRLVNLHKLIRSNGRDSLAFKASELIRDLELTVAKLSVRLQTESSMNSAFINGFSKLQDAHKKAKDNAECAQHLREFSDDFWKYIES